MSRVCIYCLESKPLSGFKGEDHVIPRAFGSFVNSPTLDCVCDECNGYFGRTIELATFRDSLEAVLRLFHRTKPAKEGVRELGSKRIVTTLGGDDRNWNGCHATWTEEDGELVVDLVPQVGFPRLDGAGWRFVTEETLRNSEEPLPTDVDRNRLLLISQSQEMGERLIAVLTRRGISFKERGPSGGPPPSVGGLAPTDLRTRIDDEILCCMAKIAFNYLAWTQHADFVLLPTFNPIRAFIRHWTIAPYPLVAVRHKPILSNDTGETLLTDGHMVTASWTDNSRNIVGQVSPFNALTYAVSLARDFEGAAWRPLRTGHHFDYTTGKITTLVNEPPS
jgi:hypothetical protein